MNVDVDWAGISREDIDTTSQATSDARTFIPSQLYNGGELTIEAEWDVDDYESISAGTPTSVWIMSKDAETVTLVPRWALALKAGYPWALQ